MTVENGTPDQGDALEVATFSPTSALLVSPWIWLTLSTLLLCGLLFVSFRKQRAIELYHEGKAFLWSKFVAVRDGSRIRLPTTTLSNPLSPAAPPSRTRLSRSLSTSSSLSSNSSDDNEDELLPFTSSTASTNSARYASFQRKSRSMVESLRDNVVSAGGSVVQSLGWNDSRGEDGVGRQSWKRLLMGTRDVDREMGGIRLGAESDNLFELGGDDEEDATSPNFGSPSRKR